MTMPKFFVSFFNFINDQCTEHIASHYIVPRHIESVVLGLSNLNVYSWSTHTHTHTTMFKQCTWGRLVSIVWQLNWLHVPQAIIRKRITFKELHTCSSPPSWEFNPLTQCLLVATPAPRIAWSLWHQIGVRMWFFQVIIRNHTNGMKSVISLFQRYQQHKYVNTCID